MSCSSSTVAAWHAGQPGGQAVISMHLILQPALLVLPLPCSRCHCMCARQGSDSDTTHLLTQCCVVCCRLQDELDRLDQQQRMRIEEEEELLAAAVEAEKQNQPVPGARAKGALGLQLVNRRNRCSQLLATCSLPGYSILACTCCCRAQHLDNIN